MRGRYERRVWRHDPSLYAPARYRKACDYAAFIPSPVTGYMQPPSAETAGIVSDAERAIQALNSHARPALAPLSRLLLRTESIASSKVEGLQLDALDLARAEARAEVGGKASPTALEILSNIDAMELAVDRASAADAFGVGEIRDVHAALLRSSAHARIAGQVRDRQNWIGGNNHNPCGADFVPPPPEEVEGLLLDVCDAMREEHLPPLMQAALLHAQFETIHPFLDGNGRTGRALVQVCLRRRGLSPSYVPPISVVLAGDRHTYIEGLEKFRNGDVDGWLAAFATATARAAGLATTYLGEVERLQEEWRDCLRHTARPRADAVAWQVIDSLPAHPVITLPVAVAATGRTKAVVNAALGQLEAAGVLARLSGGARNRSWEAVGLFDLLSGLEDGVAVDA